MSKQQNKRIWDWNPKPRSVIIVGILLFLLVVLVHGHTEYQITTSLARDTANTLRPSRATSPKNDFILCPR